MELIKSFIDLNVSANLNKWETHAENTYQCFMAILKVKIIETCLVNIKTTILQACN